MNEEELAADIEESRDRAKFLWLYLANPDRDRAAIMADSGLLALACERYATTHNQTLLLQTGSFAEFAEVIYYIGYLRGLETGKLEAAYPEK